MNKDAESATVKNDYVIQNCKSTKKFDTGAAAAINHQISLEIDPAKLINHNRGFSNPQIIVVIIAITQGLLDIGSLAAFYYQKTELLLEPQTIQLLAGIVSFPWCIKPVFGYICDKLVRKIRKIKYIVIATSIIRIIGYSMLAHLKPGITLFYFICLINSICAMFENIIAEYILVVGTRRESQINGNKKANQFPIYFGFKALGCLIGGFIGGRILTIYYPEMNFFICSMIPLITIFVALSYREARIELYEEQRDFMQELEIMKQLILQDNVLMMICFVCLINMTPNFDTLINFYLTDHLHFTSTDLANFGSFATLCYILGLILYSQYFKDIQPKKFYISTNFLLWICNISFLLVALKVLDAYNIDNKLFCLLSQGATSLIAEINFMPLLAIWCTICPVNLEATSITLFTGFINLSNNLSNYLGSFLIWMLSIHKTSYDDIWKAVVIQNGYLLVMMLAVVFVEFPDVGNDEAKEMEHELDSSLRTINTSD